MHCTEILPTLIYLANFKWFATCFNLANTKLGFEASIIHSSQCVYCATKVSTPESGDTPELVLHSSVLLQRPTTNFQTASVQVVTICHHSDTYLRVKMSTQVRLRLRGM